MFVPRGWKNADAVAAMRDFLSQPPPRRAATRDLIGELHSDDPFTLRCAADVARRISAREPGILQAHASQLIDLAAQLPDDQWQARGYVHMTAALNAVTHAQRMQLSTLLGPMIDDKRIAVRAMALEALAIVAVLEPGLRKQVLPLLESAECLGRCALRCRARRMLPVLLESEAKHRQNIPSRNSPL
jgi:hypothetical protein